MIKIGDKFRGAVFTLNDTTHELSLKSREQPFAFEGKFNRQDSELIISGIQGDDFVQFVLEWVRETKYGK